VKDCEQGDDIFVTNPGIFAKGIQRGIANSILIKRFCAALAVKRRSIPSRKVNRTTLEELFLLRGASPDGVK
jgi:Enolase, C-terminal TIM barrel domain